MVNLYSTCYDVSFSGDIDIQHIDSLLGGAGAISERKCVSCSHPVQLQPSDEPSHPMIMKDSTLQDRKHNHDQCSCTDF